MVAAAAPWVEDGVEGGAAGRAWIGRVGVLVAAAALVVAAGPAGAAAGLAVAVAWLLLPVPYTVAVAHIALVAVFPGNAALVRLAPVEAGLLLVLLEPVPGADDPVRDAGATVLAVAGIGAVALLGLRWFDAIWPAAILLAATVAAAAYGLHRYELLRLGLLEEP